MTDLLMHPATERAVMQFIGRAFHAGLIAGPAGSGKLTIAEHIAAQLLDLDRTRLTAYPHLRVIQPVDGKAIPIEAVRDLQQFMTLRIPGSRTGKVSRLAIIENAQLLTTEAQNALLKTLEEPPEHTILLLTATSPDALLPTIRSRVQVINAIAPANEDVKKYYSATYDVTAIERAIMISGGLPGLTYALLSQDEDHPLMQATAQARALLQASAYERLGMVDGLSKQKQLCQDVLFILGQMSRMALDRSQTANPKATERWQLILRASYDASTQLRQNAQTKLVLTDLMLVM